MLADKATLTKILTHHVVAGQLGPDQLAGDARDPRRATRSRSRARARTSPSATRTPTSLCGNIPTANATVYVIDTVLMPQRDRS